MNPFKITDVVVGSSGGGTIVQGDSFEYIKSIPPESIDLIASDPPYGINYVSNHYKKGNPFGTIQNDAAPFDLSRHLDEYYRILKHGGAAYLCCRWDVSGDWLRQIKDHGKFTVKNVIVWVKNNHTAGDLQGAFAFKHEQIIFMTKGRHILRGYRYPDVFDFDRIASQHLRHPTEKPIPLMQRIIEASTDKGDLVFDPYAGSGSTAEAAVMSGRRFLVCEIEEKYIQVIKNRLCVFDDDDDDGGSGGGDSNNGSILTQDSAEEEWSLSDFLGKI